MCASPAAQKVCRKKKNQTKPCLALWGFLSWCGGVGAGTGTQEHHQGYFRCSSMFPVLKTRLFYGSTDLASTSGFSGCHLPHRSPAETPATACNQSTRWGSLPAVFACFRCRLCCYYFSAQRCCTSRKEITAGAEQRNRPSHPVLCRQITKKKLKARL